MSPVKAPDDSARQSWPPPSTPVPPTASAKRCTRVAGGQIAPRAAGGRASTAAATARASSSDSSRPFIFQFPAISGRRAVIGKAPVVPKSSVAPYAMPTGLSRRIRATLAGLDAAPLYRRGGANAPRSEGLSVHARFYAEVRQILARPGSVRSPDGGLRRVRREQRHPWLRLEQQRGRGRRSQGHRLRLQARGRQLQGAAGATLPAADHPGTGPATGARSPGARGAGLSRVPRRAAVADGSSGFGQDVRGRAAQGAGVLRLR